MIFSQKIAEKQKGVCVYTCMTTEIHNRNSSNRAGTIILQMRLCCYMTRILIAIWFIFAKFCQAVTCHVTHYITPIVKFDKTNVLSVVNTHNSYYSKRKKAVGCMANRKKTRQQDGDKKNIYNFCRNLSLKIR